MTDKPITVDKSTLKLGVKEPVDSPKRDQGRFEQKIATEESPQSIIDRLSTDKRHLMSGIKIKIHGRNINSDPYDKNTYVTIYTDNVNPNLPDNREFNELCDYVSTHFSIVRDKPKKLADVHTRSKIETLITNDEIAQKAYSFYEKDGNIVGEL